MDYTQLGRSGLMVSEIAYGNWITHGSQVAEDAARACVAAALDEGITTFDTADVYAGTRAEAVLGRALQGVRRESVEICTKVYWPTGPGPNDRGLSRKHIMESVHGSLRRLGTDYVDLYQPCRLDRDVPIEDTVGAIAELVEAGYVRYIGLSEMGADTIRRAHAAHPITALQIEYSLMSRGIEAEILPTVRELGIGVTAYAVLSRGLIGETGRAVGAGDPRTRFPRFRAENLSQNMSLVQALERVAASHSVSAAQLAFAWVASRGEDIVPLIGTKRRSRLDEALRAFDITLTPAEIDAIETAVPASAVAGQRYDEGSMAALDSER
jgi:aryl-alcohol dehydrogenase-like predicted oxidoreductase